MQEVRLIVVCISVSDIQTTINRTYLTTTLAERKRTFRGMEYRYHTVLFS